MPAFPDIRDHFIDARWRDRFEDEVLLVAQKLKGKVRALRGEWEKDQFILRAEVAGEDCEIIHWQNSPGRWDFESTCPCDTRTFCPHAAAALIVAGKSGKIDELLKESTGVSPVVAQTPAPAAQSPADHRSPITAPTFHLRITREATDSKVVRLLLQALKIADTGEWVVARPEVIYGTHRISLTGKPGLREHPLPDGTILLRDPAAEMNAILQLQQSGLTSLTANAQFRFLLAIDQSKSAKPQGPAPASAAGLWFPNPSHGTIDQFWPWLRSTGSPQLAAAGWSVHFDSEVGHEVIELDPDAFKY
nr:hypothetical protein [Akkermansiaceae bacterium]